MRLATIINPSLFLALAVVGWQATAGAVSALELARSIRCSAFPSAIGVDLQGGDKSAPDKYFSGTANWNYSSTDRLVCKTSSTEVRCNGFWDVDRVKADFRVETQSDGTFKGKLIDPSGHLVVMGCLPSWDPLP